MEVKKKSYKKVKKRVLKWRKYLYGSEKELVGSEEEDKDNNKNLMSITFHKVKIYYHPLYLIILISQFIRLSFVHS